MDNGKWKTDNRQCKWKIKHGKQKMKNVNLKMIKEKWRKANGKMENEI